ncbi:hypothetical protein [Lyngbya confervoides]|uniref:Uncharacterized protein n=1 Tax=Lyngbya confervoides BDU141951 TaxID=1574623 RepID=A0ABD4T810_9CYAN|nr:hypothetical protein [Lyngbya confervoides]MCM1984924.1 hypothetical protein [Lyngbya confervoides BDU141951]
MTAFPARLHVLLARDAPLGVVIRRGPAKQVATVLWDRRGDRWDLGQWMKGRIYERRCDLSPDGKYLIYFAMNGHWQSPTRGSWTAISRAPYLKALALFPQGHCWLGGGLWTGPRRCWLNGCGLHGAMGTMPEGVEQEADPPAHSVGGECLSVYFPRLHRDGWHWVDRSQAGQVDRRDIWEKARGDQWRLRKIAHAQVNPGPGRGCYWDEHELLHPATGQWLEFPDWEWAEWDGPRLVWASGGKLWTGTLGEAGLVGERVLYDFNGMSFEARQAPD